MKHALASALVVLAVPPMAALRNADGPADAPADGAGPRAAPAAAAAPRDPIDVNFVLAAVNAEVVTHRDALIEWRLEGRRSADPDRPAAPRTADEELEQAKRIVIDRLWLEHARAFPAWADIVTPKMVEDEAKAIWGTLWTDPSIPSDERQRMRDRAESSLAHQLVLQSDPQFRRVSVARPEDVRAVWQQRPDLHRKPTRVQLGRVLLGKEVHGEGRGEKAAALRQLAIAKGSLEAAATELAPGDYALLRIDDLEHNEDLRDDVLAFAREGEPGDLSPPIAGGSSVMLFSVVAKEPGRDIPFDEAAPQIREFLQRMAREEVAQRYFVTRILREAFFLPGHLFDDEIERVLPGATKGREQRDQQGS